MANRASFSLCSYTHQIIRLHRFAYSTSIVRCLFRGVTVSDARGFGSEGGSRERQGAPHLTGFLFRFCVRMVEAPLIGPLIISMLKKLNKINEKRNPVLSFLMKKGDLKFELKRP